jgi:hypothetical protein
MKRYSLWLVLAALLAVTLMPATAQNGPRIPPLTKNFSDHNNLSSALEINPTISISTTNANSATLEGSELQPSCGNVVETLWYEMYLSAGQLSVSSAANYITSSDSVVAVYRAPNNSPNFATLIEVACSDNGSGSGVIPFTALPTGLYLVQIGAKDSITPGASSVVNATISFLPDDPLPNDEVSGATNLKFSADVVLWNVQNATNNPNEPIDPTLSPADQLSNTVWYKFTLTTEGVVVFQTVDDAVVDLYFSVFEDNGGGLIPVTGDYNYVGQVFPAGTYYLRVAAVDEPAGVGNNGVSYYNFIAARYLIPTNYTFSVDNENQVSSMIGWKVKNATTDGAGCTVAPNNCYFGFVSDGASEKTLLKGKFTLNNVKLKPNDGMALQIGVQNLTGDPNLQYKLVLTDASGATQVYSMNVTDPLASTLFNITPVTSSFVPVKGVVKIKNKDKDAGDAIRVFAVITVPLRLGADTRSSDNGLFASVLSKLTNASASSQTEAAPLPLPQP